MKKLLIILAAMALIGVMTPATMGSDKFLIYVYDNQSEERPVSGVWVRIWEGDSLIDSGYTDSDGIFGTYLNSGTKYRITAETDSLSGEWNDFVDRSKNYKIKIGVE
jgi:hypothetical protein